MDFMHILGQKEATWNTIFSIFERRRGPQTSRGPGKLSPLSSPLNGPAQTHTVTSYDLLSSYVIKNFALTIGMCIVNSHGHVNRSKDCR